MNIAEAERLRDAWKAKGSPPCDHPHSEEERTDQGRKTGNFVCTTCGDTLPEVEWRN